jgi:hypothetical protein
MRKRYSTLIAILVRQIHRPLHSYPQEESRAWVSSIECLIWGRHITSIHGKCFVTGYDTSVHSLADLAFCFGVPDGLNWGFDEHSKRTPVFRIEGSHRFAFHTRIRIWNIAHRVPTATRPYPAPVYKHPTVEITIADALRTILPSDGPMPDQLPTGHELEYANAIEVGFLTRMLPPSEHTLRL